MKFEGGSFPVSNLLASLNQLEEIPSVSAGHLTAFDKTLSLFPLA